MLTPQKRETEAQVVNREFGKIEATPRIVPALVTRVEKHYVVRLQYIPWSHSSATDSQVALPG